MQSLKASYHFSTTISDSTDANEFIIEFSSDDQEKSNPVKITKNFDELLDFLEQIDD